MIVPSIPVPMEARAMTGTIHSAANALRHGRDGSVKTVRVNIQGLFSRAEPRIKLSDKYDA